MSTRKSYTPAELRTLAKQSGPQWAGEVKAALGYAADVIDAANAALSQTAAPAPKDAESVEAIETIQQAMREMHHAYTNPNWFTGGKQSATAQFLLWHRKGLEAIRVIAELEAKAPPVAAPMTDEQIEAAAKVLAECMDYPWGPMPEQGRQAMRKHAQSVVDAANGIKQGSAQ